MEKTIYVFRHGETDWNKQKRIQGHSNIPLNQTGREQAQELRKKIEKIPFDIIYSSDLVRASETAEIAIKGREIEIKTTVALRETSLGEAEGMYINDLLEKYGVLWDQFLSYDLDISFPGGETKRESMHRAKMLIDFIVKESDFKTIGISAHGGILSGLLGSYCTEKSTPLRINNCSLYQINFCDKGKGTLLGPL